MGKEEFIRECMEALVDQHPDENERAAICYAKWERGEPIKAPGDTYTDDRAGPGVIRTAEDKSMAIGALAHGDSQEKKDVSTSQTKTVDYRLEVKEAKALDDGDVEVEGYASVFGVVDSDMDVVMQGAFTESLKEWRESGRMPPMLWQHDWREPVGRWDRIEEDETGLYVKGRLFVGDIPRARQAARLVKERALDGLSIGLIPMPPASIDEHTGIRALYRIQLMETSIVTFPALEVARLTGARDTGNGSGKSQGGGEVKSSDVPQFTTLAEAETWLRGCGWSKNAATALVSGIKRLSTTDSQPPGEPDGAAQEIAQELQTLNDSIRKLTSPEG